MIYKTTQLKYQNKYLGDTHRLKGYDYSANGAYFVTINTKNRVHFFGEIQNGEMKLSELGEIAYQSWLNIPNHFPHVTLDEFVIMPNHIHGIIIIDWEQIDIRKNAKFCVSTNTDNKPNIPSQPCVSTNTYNKPNIPSKTRVSTDTDAPPKKSITDINTELKISQNQPSKSQPIKQHPTATGQWQPNKFGPQSKNLASIIRGFKIAVKSYTTKNKIAFSWQPRYHDIIVRSEKEMRNFQAYIRDNPRNWGKDRYSR